MRKSMRLVIVAAAMSSGLAVAACSDSGPGETGGSIRIGSALPDSYDPVLWQTSEANQAMQLVYTGLVTYKHVDGREGNELVAGLAEAMPRISAGGTTYTFRLRPGLRYSDGSPVKASDFEHTIKRLTFLGGPFSSFMSGIQGIAEYRKSKRANGDISGITSNDATGEITVKLTQPDGKFLFAIGLANTAPTPAAKSPFTSSAAIPGVGPYTMRIDDPRRRYVLTKTPGFDIPGIAKGHLETITVVKESVTQMTHDVIDGRLDFMTEDAAGDDLTLVRTKYADRFRMDPIPPNTHWFFMNQTVKPFDKRGVRRAVNYAIDSRVLRRIFGGRLEPTCNFLPPGYAGHGYVKIDPCPYGDPDGPPNIAEARRLVQRSGYKGMSVTAWGNTRDPQPAILRYYRDVLDQIGFKAKTKILDKQGYFGTIGLRQTKAQTGFMDWFQDFPHPADFFEPNLSQKALASSPTFNFAFKSNPLVDEGLAKLTPVSDPASVASEWAKLDRAVIDDADVAVYGNGLTTSFFSERMDVKNCSGVHPVYKNDFSLFCLK
jgi:peptide/nickel transport system substrate-binding protein